MLEYKEFTRVGGNETIEVDVRVISATNKALEEQIEKGAFRRDLYDRLKVVPIQSLPLKHFREDIP